MLVHDLHVRPADHRQGRGVECDLLREETPTLHCSAGGFPLPCTRARVCSNPGTSRLLRHPRRAPLAGRADRDKYSSLFVTHTTSFCVLQTQVELARWANLLFLQDLKDLASRRLW